MKVLVTGAFGNIGSSTLAELHLQGHTVRAFDVPTKANLKKARAWASRVEIVWGDLRQPQDVAAAVHGQDVVIHLAFIIPKLSATGVGTDEQPEWAEAINVGGTANLLEALKAQPGPPKIIFTSSLHVYGLTHDQPPPRRADDPLLATDRYSLHKIRCEEMVRESGLPWAVFRLAATLPLDLRLDPAMFTIPLDNRMEFVHTRDVGLALANAAASEEVWGKTWLLGGGERCQFLYGEMVKQVLNASGVGMLPAEAFDAQPFGADWLDSRVTEEVLHYQRHTLADWSQDLRRRLGPRRHLAWLCQPLVRYWLLRRSPRFRRANGQPNVLAILRSLYRRQPEDQALGGA
ncbi:MAG: NAD(P)-dependent oxidoreductase [Chloroflexi bacterium]|nr:NAD(P)-dependent oxidoreductase [Chloroflexota bacterium]